MWQWSCEQRGGQCVSARQRCSHWLGLWLPGADTAVAFASVQSSGGVQCRTAAGAAGPVSRGRWWLQCAACSHLLQRSKWSLPPQQLSAEIVTTLGRPEHLSVFTNAKPYIPNIHYVSVSAHKQYSKALCIDSSRYAAHSSPVRSYLIRIHFYSLSCFFVFFTKDRSLPTEMLKRKVVC